MRMPVSVGRLPACSERARFSATCRSWMAERAQPLDVRVRLGDVRDGVDIGHELGEGGVGTRDVVDGVLVLEVLGHRDDVGEVPLGDGERDALVGRQRVDVDGGHLVERVLRQLCRLQAVGTGQVVEAIIVLSQQRREPQVGDVLGEPGEHRLARPRRRTPRTRGPAPSSASSPPGLSQTSEARAGPSPGGTADDAHADARITTAIIVLAVRRGVTRSPCTRVWFEDSSGGRATGRVKTRGGVPWT